MDVNLVVLNGKLAIAPEYREFESGSRLLRLLVTVKCDHPRRRVDVVPVTLWDPPPKLAEEELIPGCGVWVVGAVQRRFWESDDGRKSRIEVVAHHVQPVALDSVEA